MYSPYQILISDYNYIPYFFDWQYLYEAGEILYTYTLIVYSQENQFADVSHFNKELKKKGGGGGVARFQCNK